MEIAVVKRLWAHAPCSSTTTALYTAVVLSLLVGVANLGVVFCIDVLSGSSVCSTRTSSYAASNFCRRARQGTSEGPWISIIIECRSVPPPPLCPPPHLPALYVFLRITYLICCILYFLCRMFSRQHHRSHTPYRDTTVSIPMFYYQ